MHRAPLLLSFISLVFIVPRSPVSGQTLVAPTVLDPGATVSPLANGYTGNAQAKLFDYTESFTFLDGPAGTLRERVLQYPNIVTPAHPYGSGLYFDYEITLTSGDVTQLIAPGYAGFDVSVKECGIPGCGGSGAGGVSAAAASRTADGDDVAFFFNGDLIGGTHSANLQLLTNAHAFIDPPLATLVNAAGGTFSVPIVAPTIPEASTWAMMALGFLGLGFVARSNRGSAVQGG